MSREEDNTNVCENQETFNKAVDEALREYTDNETPNPTARSIALSIAYILLILLFLVWAVYLVSTEKKSDERVIHFLYAIILSPIYVLSHYLNEIY